MTVELHDNLYSKLVCSCWHLTEAIINECTSQSRSSYTDSSLHRVFL